jgi:UDP-N-acetylglucosamine--N-acetylmuramyl-(pentapeptide) pyrophosphoryl-undecaprenol N-acetylglucosamine transferase
MRAEREPFRVVIAGGGTGGHLFPALALADQLVACEPRTSLLFVGSVGGLEQRLVPARGYPLELLRAKKVRGIGGASRLLALGSLPLSMLSAARTIVRFSPHVVVGVGGYASAPVVLAAIPMRVPVVLLEQNAIPGTVNRLLARLADTVVISFRRAAHYLPVQHTLLLGNPVRPELVADLEAKRSGPGTGQSCLLVLGGSQGARAINQLVSEHAAALLAGVPGLRIIHQTGPADLAWVRQRYERSGLAARIRVEAFVEDMAAAYGQADLALCRSGATTLAELCVAGLPAVLVPYPYAADDHQAANAEDLVSAGGAVMVRQDTLSGERMVTLLTELMNDRDRLDRMGTAMRSSAHPEAASSIARLLLERFAGKVR